MKYAWIENNAIRDIAWADPKDIYHPDVAKFYDTLVPDDAKNGYLWDGVNATEPEPTVSTPEPAPRRWNAGNFRNAMTLAEKVKWDNDSAPEIVTVKQELGSSADQTKTQELVDYLVSENLISQNTASKIMS